MNIDALCVSNDYCAITLFDSTKLVVWRQKDGEFFELDLSCKTDSKAGDYLEFTASCDYENGIILLNRMRMSLDRTRIAVDLGTGTFREARNSQEENGTSIQTFKNEDYGFRLFENQKSIYRNKKLLINIDSLERDKLQLYQAFLLKKGFKVALHWTVSKRQSLARFLERIDTNSPQKTVVVIESAETFIEFMADAHLFPKVSLIVLKNLAFANELVTHFQTHDFPTQLPRTCEIMIANQQNDDETRIMRVFLAVFKERYPNNKIYYLEYNYLVPDSFGSLMVLFLA